MSFFAWDNSLQLGVDSMDAEHQGLIGQMNAIHDQVEASASKSVVSRLLVGLAAATRTHFEHEERLMLAANYAGFDTHARVHVDLLAKLDHHIAEFQAGPGTLSAGFFSFLRLWLTAHIKGIDKKYAPVVSARRVA